MQTTANPVAASALRQALIQERAKTLEAIYAQTYPMVLHYVKQNGGTADDAKDLVQEGVILFYEKAVAGQLTLTASPSTYLIAVCKNLWRRELEKRSRQPGLPPDLTGTVQEEELTEPEAAANSLVYYVEQLGERCQAILVAFYYLGRRMDQIAEEHQYRNVRSATVQKFKCLERLRKSLSSFSYHHFN
jgi:RNA polymerase sigma factor (sigma-70 family)